MQRVSTNAVGKTNKIPPAAGDRLFPEQLAILKFFTKVTPNSARGLGSQVYSRQRGTETVASEECTNTIASLFRWPAKVND